MSVTFSGIAFTSILWRRGAPFQKSQRSTQSSLGLPFLNKGHNSGRSPSYNSAIRGFWFNRAYSRDVPERQIPTTNSGPEFDSCVTTCLLLNLFALWLLRPGIDGNGIDGNSGSP